MSETIHWAGTPRGICERKDSGSDATSESFDSGTTVTNSAEAYHKENVTCTVCKEHIASFRTADLAWMNDHKWALICTGESASCVVVDGNQLREELHDFMCCCGKDLDVCGLESVLEILESMKDSDDWLRDESQKPFQFSVEFEISSVTITRVDRLSYSSGATA